MSEDILERAKRVEYPDSALRILPELIAEVEANQVMLRQFQVHEDQTHAAMEKIVGNSDNFVELTRQMKAEVERLRAANLHLHEICQAQHDKIASKDARIKELEADRIAYRNLGSRIEDLETYIERLEAAFLDSEIKRLNNPDNNHSWYPGDESYVDFVNRVKREAEQNAREALERIRNGE